MITSAETISLLQAQYVEAYRIRFLFSDATEQIIDFEPFLRAARNEMTTKYLSIPEFRKFEVKY